jgi:hypothetical protein
MFARLALGWMFALALCAGMVAQANSAQPLPYPAATGGTPVAQAAFQQGSFQQAPSATAAEPVVPLENFTSESGWLARWRADHRRRAASDGWIQTDRPSFTLSDSTVPQGWIQLESGYTYAHGQEPFSTFDYSQQTHTLPELNLRWGLTDWVELRVLWAGVRAENIKIDYGSSVDHHDRTLTANMGVGAKIQATEQRGWIPKSAFVTDLFMPTANADAGWVPLVDYIYTWSLTERVSIGGSTGAVFNDLTEDIAIMQYFQSVILRFHWTPRTSLFFEWYTTASKQAGDTYWYPIADTGIQWRPLANLQLDWRIGLPLGGERQMSGVFTGVGASVRY